MIKGILLGISIAVFIVSVIFIVASGAGLLQENIITGHTIGEGALIGYSFVALAVSFVCGLFIILLFREKEIEQSD